MTLTESPIVSISRAGSASGLLGGPSRTVVWMHGEHDVATRDALLEAVLQASRLDDADVVIDLSRVAFMDASTVGAIIAARNRLRGHGRSVSLRSPSPRALRVLDGCGLLQLIGGLGDPAVR